MEILSSFDPMLRTLWYIAISSSAIFIIQTIVTFIGMDASDGISADFDGSLDDGDAPFQLFSFRNLINFFLGFSWSGIAFYQTVENKALLITIAVLTGLAFVALFFVIISQIQRFAEDNSFKIEDTLNKTASVYIPIPANKNGHGKVQVSVRGAFHEIDAITNDPLRIETGMMVRISHIESDNLVMVQRI
ncbi:hypothetical protein LX69_00092 [Breznakibacter xylanolyticus]|uniref:NfeD-like partner-binding protein n=1 Tax=Breznakibacter xylanolyticus TaxID=990 RepID=A0A2W7NJN4_9BACT|nr:serine protease [Breznakibacter xylanolyticus]PZX20671.1 hypothetical protein LX69_00092 [Breznakibacter xylanolyticus]